jgi:DNA (cytosine-5)-methyltransferase 1
LSNNPNTGTNSGKSILQPIDTITTQNRLALASVAFMDKYYGIANAQPLDKPCDTITTVDRFSLVQCEHDTPCYKVQSNDSEYTKLIKEFMQANGIKDIYMRMLTVQELKEIQGFPKDYVLLGSQPNKRSLSETV